MALVLAQRRQPSGTASQSDIHIYSGMAVVPIAIIFEYFTLFQAGLAGSFSLLAWAFIEEILKYAAAQKSGFF